MRTDCHLHSVQLRDISVKAGHDTLLSDVSFNISCGELVAVIGQNGAGKSTLFRSMLGEVKHSGSVKFLGHDGESANIVNVGYVPQQLHFDRNAPVSVLDLMCAARSSRPVWLGYNKKAKAKALELLESVECSQIAGRRLGALSGGELQRVVLACALDPMPNLLLLDEPVSGFDREGLDMFYKLVSSLREKNHMAIMLISHDFETITRYADKVLLLGGRQLTFGTPQEVFASAEFRYAFPFASGRID